MVLSNVTNEKKVFGIVYINRYLTVICFQIVMRFMVALILV
jgi:hypothetical protein